MAAVKKIAFGLEENSAGALAYVLGWVSGLIFLLAEKDNKLVRFHAMQSLMFFGALTIVTFIPIVNWFFPLYYIAGFIVWLMAIYKSYNGEKFELPVIGKLAEQQLAKMK